MIDNFAVMLTEGLMLLAVWNLLRRPDLDDESTATRDGKKGRWPRA